MRDIFSDSNELTADFIFIIISSTLSKSFIRYLFIFSLHSVCTLPKVACLNILLDQVLDELNGNDILTFFKKRILIAKEDDLVPSERSSKHLTNLFMFIIPCKFTVFF